MRTRPGSRWPPWSRRCGSTAGIEVVQIDRVMQIGMVNSSTGASAEAGIEDAVENRPDQQRGQRLRGAHARHQHDGERADEGCRAGNSAAGGRVPSCAHPQALPPPRSTSSTRDIRRSTPRLVSTCDSVRQGAHVTGSEGPNSTTTGTPNAAAMCAGPLSLPMNKARPPSGSLTRASGRFARPEICRKASRSSAGPARKTGSSPIKSRVPRLR